MLAVLRTQQTGERLRLFKLPTALNRSGSRFIIYRDASFQRCLATNRKVADAFNEEEERESCGDWEADDPNTPNVLDDQGVLEAGDANVPP